ncbi:hypothetical protein [Deinococcus yavapaiensis]|uniref:Uncharacterized protein n=1 Tax=Deinococcus yavapaiensis KR-236 TaxID=694435 RepID=A0A318S872_9DEIO|nr:hypothetical protein [Deinococcus yavapaiensis]PYE51981.1 hypothetical protein DES52_11327 [Deinococcus yavapaiensis KR-236]
MKFERVALPYAIAAIQSTSGAWTARVHDNDGIAWLALEDEHRGLTVPISPSVGRFSPGERGDASFAWEILARVKGALRDVDEDDTYGGFRRLGLLDASGDFDHVPERDDAWWDALTRAAFDVPLDAAFTPVVVVSVARAPEEPSVTWRAWAAQ